jgi:diguanylate cyclase
MMVPLFFNLALILTGIFVMRSSGISQKKKAYTVSLLFVGASFIFYMVHSIFFALFLMFTVPILMTVVYSDYALTTMVTAASLALKIISDLVIVWDPDKVNPLASDLGTIDFVISIFLLCVFYFVSMIVIRFGKEKNAASIQKEIEHYQMQQKLNRDELTEIYNRTALRKAFSSIQNDSEGNPYTFVMIDIDNFKALNDRFGHAAGDKCLKEFGGILKKNCYDGTMPFRFGGDEFCILFKDKPIENVVDTCREIQRDLKNSEVSRQRISVTASFGIAVYEKGMSVARLLKNTDEALYNAKDAKDSVCVFENGKA